MPLTQWIGPGRVAIGILLGAAMLPWSQWLLKRGYSYFSEGIAGLARSDYLSIWQVPVLRALQP